MRITRIERQKRRPGRVTLYADGTFLTGISEETLARLALRPGDELDETRLQTLRKTEELLSAKHSALRLLAVRPRTVREIRSKLREKEFSDAAISSVIGDLQGSGILDDAEFARMYIRQATTLRPLGPARLRQKLLLLGVDKSVIESALVESETLASTSGLAERAAQSYLRRLRTPADPRTRKRLGDFLLRRGFDWDTVRGVITRLLKEPDDEQGRV